MSIQSLLLIEVSGSSYEMGFQHVAQAAGLVKRFLQWIETMAKTSGVSCAGTP